jgi:hypothetical protein
MTTMRGASMNILTNPMMRQAMGAMMRGESPQTFLKNLANTNPKLQGMNFDDLEGTARELCQRNNVNMEQLAEQIRGFANSNIIN